VSKSLRIDTQLVHAGEPRPRPAGAVAMPIYQSSTFEYAGEVGYHDIRYLRCSNTPNHLALHAKIAALEGTEAALVTASGMAAISTTLLGLLSPGDHVLAHHSLYGGTHDLLTRDLPRWGIAVTFVDAARPETWETRASPKTKLFYVETITNPLMQVVALPEVARFARERGIVSAIDNTFATPVNFRPVDHGFDLVLHSATKYLNGHSDIVAGVVAGPAKLVDVVKRNLDHLGGSLDPHACFLLQRSLKTLAVRIRHQNQSALQLAQFLAAQPAVAQVHHPLLPQSASHARARELLRGAGGMLSFELRGGVEAAERLFQRLALPVNAPSLGGPETLVTRPAITSHAGLSPEERRRQGIGDGLVRVSVGLEATEDLVEDFRQALAALG